MFNYAMYTTAKSSILHITLSYEELNYLLLYTLHSLNTKYFNIHMTKLYPRVYDKYKNNILVNLNTCIHNVHLANHGRVGSYMPPITLRKYSIALCGDFIRL